MYTSTRAIWQESWAECLFWGTGQKVQQIMHYWSCMQRFSIQLQSWQISFLDCLHKLHACTPPPPPPHTHTPHTYQRMSCPTSAASRWHTWIWTAVSGPDPEEVALKLPPQTAHGTSQRWSSEKQKQVISESTQLCMKCLLVRETK